MSNQKHKRIYVSDLDGTLLRDDATMSTYTRNKLTGLLEDGVNFTIASARSVNSLRPILGEIPFRLPIIEINGAFITDYHTGNHLVINKIQSRTVRQIFDHTIEHGLMPFVSTYNGSADCLYFQKIINGAMQWYHDDRKANHDPRLRQIDDITCAFDDDVISMNVMGARQDVAQLAAELEQELAGKLENFFFENPYSPGWWWLTIHDIKACKSIAIAELLRYAAFSRENLTVFGDNLNDVKMFRMAATAVAVSNATEEIKNHASLVIGPNNDDSVVKYIADQIALGRC